MLAPPSASARTYARPSSHNLPSFFGSWAFYLVSKWLISTRLTNFRCCLHHPIVLGGRVCYSTYNTTSTFSRSLPRPTCPRLFPVALCGFITGCLIDSVALVTNGTLPIRCPALSAAQLALLLVSEFFWGPFRNLHLPWPFLVILM